MHAAHHVELLLEFLISVIDTELFKAVDFKGFKSFDKKKEKERKNRVNQLNNICRVSALQ